MQRISIEHPDPPTVATLEADWEGVCTLVSLLVTPPKSARPGLAYIAEGTFNFHAVQAEGRPKHRINGDDGTWDGWAEDQTHSMKWVSLGSEAMLLAQRLDRGWVLTYTGPTIGEDPEGNYLGFLIKVGSESGMIQNIRIKPVTDDARRKARVFGLAVVS
ncbi:MAG TPA: hypothetical protein VF272_02175 [Candidatus Saccharimonadia bacterium]